MTRRNTTLRRRLSRSLKKFSRRVRRSLFARSRRGRGRGKKCTICKQLKGLRFFGGGGGENTCSSCQQLAP